MIFPRWYCFSFRQILSKFLDTRDSDYSIQMIGKKAIVLFWGLI